MSTKEAPGVSRVEKRTIIVCRLVPTHEAYKGKSNADVEKGILEGMPPIPYVDRVKKVTVLNREERL
jgi:hypothetical protein